MDGVDGKLEVLLDPNTLSEDGTVSLKCLSVSEDAKYVAYGLSKSGSDWVSIHVMKIEDRQVLPDTLSWVKFSSIAWTHDSKGFFYSRYPAPKQEEASDAGTETNAYLNHELYYHCLGIDQSEDILCWRDPENPKFMFNASVTEDGKYVLIYIEVGCEEKNKFYYLDLSVLHEKLMDDSDRREPLPFKKLIDEFDASYETIANDGTSFTFLCNKDAPRYKLARVDLNEPEAWTDVLPESEKDVLVSAHAVAHNRLLVCYLSDVKHVLQVRDLPTGAMLYHLPIGIGSIRCISTRRKYSTVFIGFTSFLTPGIIFHCNMQSEVPDVKIFQEISVPKFDREEFEVSQVCFLTYRFIDCHHRFLSTYSSGITKNNHFPRKQQLLTKTCYEPTTCVAKRLSC